MKYLNGSFSDYKEITAGISQRSILGPLLFIIFIYMFKQSDILDQRTEFDNSNINFTAYLTSLKYVVAMTYNLYSNFHLSFHSCIDLYLFIIYLYIYSLLSHALYFDTICQEKDQQQKISRLEDKKITFLLP